MKNNFSKIINSYRERNLSLSGAESCTGGLLASSIVSIAGASDIFKGTAVCYCDSAKEKILSVPQKILQKHYAESPQTALYMALGAMSIYDSDISFSTTGFLDIPSSGEKKHLQNTVFCAVISKKIAKNIPFPSHYNGFDFEIIDVSNLEDFPSSLILSDWGVLIIKISLTPSLQRDEKRKRIVEILSTVLVEI